MATNKNPTAEQVVQRLKSSGVNCVCLDFDRTILQVHTGGVWTESLVELCQYVRPQLRDLIQALVAHNNTNDNDRRSNNSSSNISHHIYMAVVTFSGQISLVRGVLASIVGPKLAQTIPIRGEDGSWQEPYPNRGWWPKNASLDYDSAKQAHMLSAILELEKQCGGNSTIHITKESTILIDDDEYNVDTALQNGTRGVVLNPACPERLYQDILAAI
jgi:hypothetical protein